MRTFKIQVQVTADGFMGGPEGELDWMTWNWSDDQKEYVTALHKNVDTMVLGRELAGTFIPAWESGPPGETQETVDLMVNTPKVVISNTLTESPWNNATIAGGDPAATVNDLKSREGGDIITYGGATLAQHLITEGLLDDIYLFVNPTAIGTGLPVFAPGVTTQLELVEARGFDCGVTVLHYRPKR